MTNDELSACERVQMAAMAHVDGERAGLTPDEVEAHLAGCAECRAAVASLAALQPPLNNFDYESLDVDVWPAVREGIASETPRTLPERRVVLVNTIGISDWVPSTNATLAAIAAEHPNAIVMDWHAAVAADPSLLHDDRTHPNFEGIEVYAEQLARTIDQLGPG